jgi:predicted enzyme related to lactoylglutathione lyase
MSQHPIAHIEIPSKDTAAAAKFYSEAFGWSSQLDTSAGINYLMFEAAPGPGGAFVEADEHSFKVGDIVVYLGTDDLDATMAKVQAAGGMVVMPKMEVPNNGWIAWVTDPSGNRLGLFQAPAG